MHSTVDLMVENTWENLASRTLNWLTSPDRMSQFYKLFKWFKMSSIWIIKTPLQEQFALACWFSINHRVYRER